MPLPEHLFVSSTDGALYDTRVELWSRKPPVRATYSRTPRELKTLTDVKAALRAGPYAWPGGYQMYFITRDGAALSFEAVREQFRNIVYDFLHDVSTGWRVEAVEINYEDGDLFCAHTNKRIPSAYAVEDDAAEPEEEA